MGNLESEQQVETSRGLVWIERSANVLCIMVLLLAVFLIGIGACQFNFGVSRDAVSDGLDAMSNGILAAIVGITGYIFFFSVGLLIANLTVQDGGGKPA